MDPNTLGANVQQNNVLEVFVKSEAGTNVGHGKVHRFPNLRKLGFVVDVVVEFWGIRRPID